MTILKFIILASFIGLALIVARNRLTNPEVRVQFLEDLEINKQRLRKFLFFLSQFGNKAARKVIQTSGTFVEELKKGGVLFLKDCKTFFSMLTSKLVRQVKELRKDMKAFEIPSHKKDFLERLHKEKMQEEGKASSSLGELVREKQVKGFAIRTISEGEFFKEAEVDLKILERKERSLIDAIAKNPKNASFYKKLGKVYWQLDKVEDAKNCFDYALKLGAQDPEIKGWLSEIEKGIVH